MVAGPIQFKMLAGFFGCKFRIYPLLRNRCEECYIIDGCCMSDIQAEPLHLLLGPLNGNGRLSHYQPLVPVSGKIYIREKNPLIFRGSDL